MVLGIDEDTQYTKGSNGDASTSQSANKYLNPAQQFAHTTGMVEDTFSSQDVSAPTPGQWGQAGTAADQYNANATARGQQIAKTNAGTANNLAGQGNYLGNRAAPVTNYDGADRYGSLGDAQRSVVNQYVNAGGNSSGQQQQVGALNQYAQGPAGPSAAEVQLAQAGDAAQRSALSMARSGRGAGDSAAALRDASFQNANTQGTIAGQTAQLRAQEAATQRQQQLQALEAALGGATAIRGSDLATAQTAQGTRAQDLQAQGQVAGEEQFRTNTQLQQTGMNDAARSNMYGTGLGYAQLGQQGELGYAQLGQNAYNSQADYELNQQRMRLDADKANQNADTERDSANANMVGSFLGAMSDERVKKLKQRETALSKALGGSSSELETLGNAPGYSYEYKDTSMPGTAPGRQVSSMAQDLEKGPLGSRIVSETPHGKMVNYEEVIKMTPGAITELNQKVAALEKALGRSAA